MGGVFPIDEAYRLSETENARIFEEIILISEYGDLHEAAQPSVHFFGAQPGAGKTRPEALVIARLTELDGPGAVMPIIGDDFRPYHPSYTQLMAEDDQRAAEFTAADAGRWVQRAITHSLAVRPHVIIEGTLRRPTVTLDSARPYAHAGFTTALHVMAVHEHVSRSRIFERYLRQIQHRGVGRYTPHEAHQIAYRALPGSVEELIQSSVFDSVHLYSMHGEEVSAAQRGDLSAERELQHVLAQARATPPDPEEVLTRLDRYTDAARRLGKQEMLRDIKRLQAEVAG